MNNNKVVALVVGAIVALFAFSLLLRFVLLSEHGLPVGWIFFGLPIGGIGVLLLLLRLGLLNNFVERSGATIPTWLHSSGVQAPPQPAPPATASVSQRLQELDTLRASGAISDTEYTARRQRILTDL
jgi:Short C-terminal domain